MMRNQSDDLRNPDHLSNLKPLDSIRGTIVGAESQEPKWPLAGTDHVAHQRNTDDSAHQRISGRRSRSRKQFDASADIGQAPMFALTTFSGGTELDWDWD